MRSRWSGRAIEQLMNRAAKSGALDLPMSQDEAAFHLLSSPSVELSSNRSAEFAAMIQEAIRQRQERESRISTRVGTLGEYVDKALERYGSALELGQVESLILPGLNEAGLAAVRRDKIDQVQPSFVASIIIALAIPADDVGRLIEGSFRILQLRDHKLLGFSNARVAEAPNSAARGKSTLRIMQKLMLAVDEDKQLTSLGSEVNKYVEAVLKELAQRHYVAPRRNV